MKKSFVILVLLVLLSAMIIVESGFAYGDLVYNSQTTITHKLHISEDERLDENLTYKFVIDQNPHIELPNDVVSGEESNFVTGAPKFVIEDGLDSSKSIYYTESNKTNIQTLKFDWSNVTFKQPGSYYWKITKSVTPALTTGAKYENNNPELYIYAVVKNDPSSNEGLSVAGEGLLGLKIPGQPSTENKFYNLEDGYNSVPLDLTIKKSVEGNFVSKDRYFKFAITLNLPPRITEAYNYTIENGNFDISGKDIFKYGNFSNPSPITSHTLIPGQSSTFSIYLKDGQEFKIEDLPEGTTFTITEEQIEGYNEPQKEYEPSGASTSALHDDTTVKFKNSSNDTPTGLMLETAAPVFGMLLGLSILAFVALNRRKKQSNH